MESSIFLFFLLCMWGEIVSLFYSMVCFPTTGQASEVCRRGKPFPDKSDTSLLEVVQPGQYYKQIVLDFLVFVFP